MDKVFIVFEDIFRRIFGPATVFFIVLLLEHILWLHLSDASASFIRRNPLETIFQSCRALNPEGLTAPMLLAILVGTGYFLKPFHDFLFDARLKGSFQELVGANNEVTLLSSLRAKVIQQIEDTPNLKSCLQATPEVQDYQLYEILGGIDQRPTDRFVDDARSTGYFFASVFVVSLAYIPFSSKGMMVALAFLAGLA